MDDWELRARSLVMRLNQAADELLDLIEGYHGSHPTDDGLRPTDEETAQAYE